MSAPTAPRPVTPLAILAASLARLEEEVTSGDAVDGVVLAQLRRARELACGLDPYVVACTTPASPALAALARRTDEEDWGSGPAGGGVLEREMLSGHLEGQTLKMLVRATRATRVLEIGMFTGYSALAMAEGVGEHGVVVALEVDEHAAQLAQECFADSPVGDRISVRLGPALATLEALAAEGEVFDFVFVDADKPGYVDYFRTLLDRGLLAPGALVCVDNTLLQGEPYLAEGRSANGRAVAAFNQAVADDPRVEQVVLPLRDGLTLIQQVEA
ncbi:MAG: class I SAM-dependent methyltransferase [Nocardioides sp.]|nr:class I SAM-dependent methyltransferase [Nocardioides sp.]